MRRLRTQPLTPGEARYVLERLLADRRITAADVKNGSAEKPAIVREVRELVETG